MGRANIRNQQPNQRRLTIRTVCRDIRVTGGGHVVGNCGWFPFEFLRRTDGSVTHVHEFNPDLHLSPRFFASFTKALHHRMESTTIFPERQFTLRTLASIERLTETLTLRTQRIEAGQRDATQRAVFPSYLQASAPEMLVVRRGDSSAATDKDLQKPAERYARQQQQQHAAPQIDVGALTNQVMSAIDRRFVAMRERLGRI